MSEMNSQIQVNDLEKFFMLDVKIKKLMSTLAPNPECAYSIRETMRYGEKFYTTIVGIEDDFYTMMEAIQIGNPDRDYVKDLFKKIKKEVITCNYKFERLKQCYQNRVSDMSEEIIEGAKDDLKGYYMFSDRSGLVAKCKTINELLHVFHSYVMNTEHILQGIPATHEKKIDDTYTLALRGNDSSMALEIFNSFPSRTSCGDTDIVSLPKNNKVIMMIRDKCHALTIEITKEEGAIWVNYFIPKVCNLQMVNALPGVRKIDETATTTTGTFVTDEEHFSESLFDFIKKVPTDSDMVILDDYEMDIFQPDERKRV